MKARDLSLITKGIAVVFAIVGFIILPLRSATEIVTICVYVAGAFLPVDISLIKTATKKE